MGDITFNKSSLNFHKESKVTTLLCSTVYHKVGGRERWLWVGNPHHESLDSKGMTSWVLREGCRWIINDRVHAGHPQTVTHSTDLFLCQGIQLGVNLSLKNQLYTIITWPLAKHTAFHTFRSSTIKMTEDMSKSLPESSPVFRLWYEGGRELSGVGGSNSTGTQQIQWLLVQKHSHW